MDKIIWKPEHDGQTITGTLTQNTKDTYHIKSNIYEYIIHKEPRINKALQKITSGTHIWLRYCKNYDYPHDFYRVVIR